MSQRDNRADITWPRAIIWDLDGTLIDSAPDLATALNTVLNEQDLNSLTIPQVRLMVGGGVAKLIERAFRGSRVELDAEGAEALAPGFMEIYSNCATNKTTLLPAAGRMLNYFYNAGVQQGLCTNKPEAVTIKILHALGPEEAAPPAPSNRHGTTGCHPTRVHHGRRLRCRRRSGPRRWHTNRPGTGRIHWRTG